MIRKKRTIPTFLSCLTFVSRPSYLTRCRGSKLVLLHRVKERETPSLSAQASVAPFSLKVAWSGKSLIRGGARPWRLAGWVDVVVRAAGRQCPLWLGGPPQVQSRGVTHSSQHPATYYNGPWPLNPTRPFLKIDMRHRDYRHDQET